jgi:hypothetical protein
MLGYAFTKIDAQLRTTDIYHRNCFFATLKRSKYESTFIDIMQTFAQSIMSCEYSPAFVFSVSYIGAPFIGKMSFGA